MTKGLFALLHLLYVCNTAVKETSCVVLWALQCIKLNVLLCILQKIYIVSKHYMKLILLHYV